MAMASSPSLLPSAKEEFRSKEYWRKFFQQRDGKAFEWYGEWKNFSANVRSQLVDTAGAILLPGCGNSNLSEQLWSAGHRNLTNIDFDRGVISEMTAKLGKKFPGITWLEMDVRTMSFTSGSFGAVFDKGTLDAMLPDDSPVAAADVAKYFSEVNRVLKPGGLFLIISLLQDHVLRMLTAWHAGASCGGTIPSPCAIGTWQSMEVHTFAANDMASPLCPFFLVLCKSGSIVLPCTEQPTFPVTLHVPHRFEGVDPTEEAFAAAGLGPKSKAGKGSDIALALSAPTTLSVTGGQCTLTESGIGHVTDEVHSIQRSYVTARQLQSLMGDTHLSFDLWALGEGTASLSACSVSIQALTPAGDAAPFPGARVRYSVTVLDTPNPPGGAPRATCKAGVIIVPQGREHEFVFSSREGQLSLASNITADRLLIVCLARGWEWAGFNSAKVQAELDPVVKTMVPRACLRAKGGVPYLAVSQDLGSVSVVAEGSSNLSGEYRVEEVPDDEEDSMAAGERTHFLRRLVFASNRAAIQTEVCVSHPTKGGVDFQHERLSFAYHQGMVAATVLLKKALDGASAGMSPDHRLPVAVLGLGGGALASFLASRFQWLSVLAIELDPSMVDVARTHFGGLFADDRGHGAPAEGSAACCLRLCDISDSTLADLCCPTPASSPPTSSQVRVIVGDALEFVKRVAALPEGAPRLGAIYVDVDAKAKELKVGLSFPPLPFVSRSWLECTHRALEKDRQGMLCMNLGARAKALYAAAVAAVSREYGEGCTGSMPTGEDLNAVVTAFHGLASDRLSALVAEVLVADMLSDMKAEGAGIGSTVHAVHGIDAYSREWLETLTENWGGNAGLSAGKVRP